MLLLLIGNSTVYGVVVQSLYIVKRSYGEEEVWPITLKAKKRKFPTLYALHYLCVTLAKGTALLPESAGLKLFIKQGIHPPKPVLPNLFQPRHTFLEPLTRRHTAFMALNL